MLDKLTSALTRRRVLIGLGTACTAAAAAPDMALSEISENPDLIALGNAMPAALQAYLDANDTVANLVAQWSPHWPKPTPELQWYGMGGKTYRGIDGREIEMPWGVLGHTNVPNLGTPEIFTADWERHEAEAVRLSATKSQRGLKSARFWAERNKAVIAPARDFWAEVDRITDASGIEAAQAAKADAVQGLHDLVEATMAAQETSIAGVVIKAQALTAWGRVEWMHKVSQMVNSRSQGISQVDWACELAQSIMRQGGAL